MQAAAGRAGLPPGWDESEQEMIDAFFNHSVPKVARNPCSASDCNGFAKSIMYPDDVMLVNNQGATSYTLMCPTRQKIIQFRLNKLDTTFLDKAKEIYGDLVAAQTPHQAFGLPVYTCDLLPGEIHFMKDISRNDFPLEREKRTVTDLAKFVARSSHFPYPGSSYMASSWTLSAADTFRNFDDHTNLKSIEPEVYAAIISIGSRLHLLDTLPPVLMHYDLVGQNIFVDEAGALTGVIDWDGAGIEAFGMVIFALYEAFFGSMEGGHWSPYDSLAGDAFPGQTACQILETAFWDTLWAHLGPGLSKEGSEEAVFVALGVGIVNRYFNAEMLNEIELRKANHARSLDYTKGILMHIRNIRCQ